MKKKFKNSRNILLVLLFLITSIGFSKVNVSGNINIWFDTTNRTNDTRKAKRHVGNMDDREFEEKAFMINHKGYSFLRDNYGNKLLLQVIFGSRGEVVQENLYYTKRYTNNCIGVKSDDSVCFTIKSNGLPSIWDRYESKYIFEGHFVNVKINNPYFQKKYYSDSEDLFEF